VNAPAPSARGRPRLPPRARRAALAVAVLAASAGVPAHGAGFPSVEAADWARAYYGAGPLCSTATVGGLSFEPGRIRVSLDIDPRWARSLARTEERIRARWFALHCPPRLLPVWGLLADDQDILVEGSLPGYGHYRLGCRDFLAGRRGAAPAPAAAG
jgi:hypothetical protein